MRIVWLNRNNKAVGGELKEAKMLQDPRKTAEMDGRWIGGFVTKMQWLSWYFGRKVYYSNFR